MIIIDLNKIFKKINFQNYNYIILIKYISYINKIDFSLLLVFGINILPK